MEDSESSSFSNDEFTEFQQDPVDQDAMEEESIERSQSRGRGRQRIPEQWSRVISIDFDNLRREHVHEMGPDRLVVAQMPNEPSKRRNKEWKPLFFPKAWAKDHGDIQLEAF